MIAYEGSRTPPPSRELRALRFDLPLPDRPEMRSK